MSERPEPPESSPDSNIPLEASTGRPPAKPKERDVAVAWLIHELGQGESPGTEGAPESEASDRQLWRRTQWAAVRHKSAATESLRTQSRNSRAKVDADIKDREEQTSAAIQNERKLTQAGIADQKRRTEAEMNGLERRDETTQVERYFWMAVAAIGLIAAIVLAFLTAGHSAWEYRISPAAGLLLLGGSGLQLWSITRPRAPD
jgi:hypothetical protein